MNNPPFFTSGSSQHMSYQCLDLNHGEIRGPPPERKLPCLQSKVHNKRLPLWMDRCHDGYVLPMAPLVHCRRRLVIVRVRLICCSNKNRIPIIRLTIRRNGSNDGITLAGTRDDRPGRKRIPWHRHGAGMTTADGLGKSSDFKLMRTVTWHDGSKPTRGRSIGPFPAHPRRFGVSFSRVFLDMFKYRIRLGALVRQSRESTLPNLPPGKNGKAFNVPARP